MGLNNCFSNRDLRVLAKNFDVVLGGWESLPEQKGLHIATGLCDTKKREYVDISFPRCGGNFGDLWEKYSAGHVGHEHVMEQHKELPHDFTREEKERSVSLTLILKEERILGRIDEVEYRLVNEPINSEEWNIESGPRVVVRIPRCHINEDKLSKVASQREVLEKAGELVKAVAKASGISEHEIRGYNVHGITLNHPGLAAGLACELGQKNHHKVNKVRDSLRDAGLELEESFGDLGEEGEYFVRLENPYDENLMEKLRKAAEKTSATLQ